VIAIAEIKYRTDQESYETLLDVKTRLGFTWKELMDEAIFEFLINHKEKISRYMNLNTRNKRETRTQRELYFFKNELNRLFKQVSWKYKTYAEIKDYSIVTDMIDRALERYEFLDERIKQQLKGERDDFAMLKDRRTFEVQFETQIPQLEGKKGIKAKR